MKTMNTTGMMSASITRCNATRAATAAMLGLLLAPQVSLGVNLLTDAGFESNPLTTAANSLGNFPGFQGVWGQENSITIGTDMGISPASGALQLRMDVTGGVTTQAFQTVDVTSFAALIDAGGATLNASALLNANLAAPVGGVYISYFSANNYGSLIGPMNLNVINLDSNPGTWETASVTATVPVNTRWILLQCAYAETSLYSTNGTVGSGYVDNVYMEIVPTPGSMAILGLGGLLACRRRRA
ncbi:MAG: hypothetical protein H7210_13810 [Pyrinomonadaceae bacterium]|nr:hypothetical protein [Phycisphaerales bacterium]